MKIWIFLNLAMYQALAAMAEGHHQGKALAGSLLGGVQAAAGTSAAIVPGFVTDNPKEASLDNGSIGGATSAEVRSNEASVAISENSRTRQKFVLDPSTDPLFINANKATANPEQTMQEMIVETSYGSGGDQDEIVECMEGGDEYRQSCRKHLVVNIQITQAKKFISGYQTDTRDCRLNSEYFCVPHLNCCPSVPVYSTIPRKVEIVSEEWIDGCAVLEAQSDEGLCRYEEEIVGPQETRSIQGPVVGSSAFDSESIKRDAWEKTYVYACLKKIEGTCDALRAKGCIQISSVCAEEIGGVCVAWKQTFRCPSAKKKTRKYRDRKSVV